tara:strand:+ start:1227 stop:1415 length:189 start_codon:yes stop_codon:yes gene_type:complete
MTEAVQEISQYCPHCGESITLLIDITQGVCIEDCSVCCQPMLVSFELDNGGEVIHLHLSADI